MARYSDTVRDQNQAPIPGVKVTVTKQDGAPPVLTDDSGNALSQPLVTDDYGAFFFNADVGYYDLAYHYGGRLVNTVKNLPVGGAATSFDVTVEMIELRDEAVAAAGTATEQAAIATTAAGEAATERDAGEVARSGAEAAQAGAEAARDAATLGAGIYDDTADGLAGTAEGDYFSIPSGSADGYLDLYRHDAGPVATLIDTYPNKDALDAAVLAAGQAATDATAALGALALHSDTLRVGVRGTPVTAASSASQTLVFPEPVASAGYLNAITLYATGTGTVKVRRFTRGNGTFTQAGSDITLSVVSGVNTFSAGSGFSRVQVAAGEYLGVYGSGVLAVDTVNADGGGAYIGSGDVTSFTDNDVFLTRSPQIGFDIQIPKTVALSRQIARIAANNGAAPAWVKDATAIDIDLVRGLVWVPDRREVQPITDWIEFQTSDGYIENGRGGLTSVPAGAPRIGPNGLRIDAHETRNIFTSPLAPATQAVTWTSSAYLQVWGPGEVTYPLNNGRTGRARPGYPVTISTAEVTMPVTFTVSGSPVAIMLENPAPSAGAGSAFTLQNPRPGDLLRMKAQMMSALNGTEGTVLIETEGVLTNQRAMGGAGSIAVYRTADGTATTTNGTTTLAAAASSAMSWSRIARVAVAHSGAGRSIAFGGVSNTDANARGSFDTIGRSGVLSDTNRGASMLMRRIQIWPTRKADADLQRLTKQDGGVVLADIAYPSSIDPTTYPMLGARISYDPSRLNADLLVVMHGFSQSARDFVDETLTRFAAKGFFVVAVEMRGGPDTNLSDASGREIMDIVDAVHYARERFGQLVSQDRGHIVGYSGGGGNVLACAMKCPDLFAGFVDHFGMSDYGYDATYGWYYTNPSFASALDAKIGVPASVPSKYQSRYAIEGVPVNLQGGRLLMFHDNDDTSVSVVQSQQMRDAMIAASNARYEYWETDASEIFPATVAYTHGLPGAGGNAVSEGIWIPRLATVQPWIVPATGTLRVHGFLVTKRFSIWLGDGTDGVATVAYNTTTGVYTVTPVAGSPLTVTIDQGGRTKTQVISSATALTVEAP